MLNDLWIEAACLDGSHENCKGHVFDGFCGCDCHFRGL